MSKPPKELGEEPGLFDFEDVSADEAAMQRAEADFAAGRYISHEAVMRWVKSWGADNPLPPPKCGD